MNQSVKSKCIKHSVKSECIKHSVKSKCIKQSVKSDCIKKSVKSECIKQSVKSDCIKHSVKLHLPGGHWSRVPAENKSHEKITLVAASQPWNRLGLTLYK